jgi:hypothetical protein
MLTTGTRNKMSSPEMIVYDVTPEPYGSGTYVHEENPGNDFNEQVCPIPQDSHIETTEFLKERRVRDLGSLITKKVVAANGTAYIKQIALPNDQRFDTGVTLTTPWCTRIPGFNTELQKMMMAYGVASEMLGPPMLPISIDTFVHLPEKVTLLQDVVVQHESFGQSAIDGYFRGDSAISVGYSRGAMIGWGMIAYEKNFDRKIEYFDASDPCLVRATNAEDLNLFDLNTYTYLLREIRAGARAIGRHSLRQMISLPKSLNLTVSGALEIPATGLAIFGGQTKQFIERIRKDAFGQVRLYDKSIFNQADDLKEMLSDHPNINIEVRDGYHLSGMRPGVRLAAAGRVYLAQKALQQNISLEEVDFGSISGMPHQST